MTQTTRPGTAALAALALLGGLLLPLFGNSSVSAYGQEPELLSRFVQNSNPSDAALKALNEGRKHINDEEWAKASSTLDKFIADYPTDKNADAAYYFLAFALKQQNKFREADGALVRLIGRFPGSSWRDDAEKMRVEIAGRTGNADLIAQATRDAADIELKIIALQGLFQSDPVRATALVNEILRPGAQAHIRLREAAITLLGRYGGKQAIPALTNLMRNEPDLKLRRAAIISLGRTDDESVLQPLKEQALVREAKFNDEGPVDAAMHAIADHDSPRATGILSEIAQTAGNIEARKHAIYLLATRRKGEPAVDELFRIYDADQNIEIRKQVIDGLSNRLSPRAKDKLIELARSASNVELRKQALNSLGRRNDPQYLGLLLQLYDSERDEALKDGLLGAFCRSEQKPALQKMMQIVSSGGESVERRKRAITCLSRSKDPDVLRFLENILR